MDPQGKEVRECLILENLLGKMLIKGDRVLETYSFTKWKSGKYLQSTFPKPNVYLVEHVD
jgi:hypothetical protein